MQKMHMTCSVYTLYNWCSRAAMFHQDSERKFAQAIYQISHSNPFDEDENARLEKAALEMELPSEVHEIAGSAPKVAGRPELALLVARTEGVAGMALGVWRTECDRMSTTLFCIATWSCSSSFSTIAGISKSQIAESLSKTDPDLPNTRPSRGRGLRIAYFDRYASEVGRFLGPTPWYSDPRFSAAHRFALHFQIQRAFYFIHGKIRGRSKAIERLRAAVFQSIFTHNPLRYDESLHDRMHDITTLITGPSGTGKDLVAEAIGQSRYIRFDTQKKAFVENVGGDFHPVNLSAIPSELIEAELFGNCKGAFTGALQDRVGWLELCGPFHSVFLDEIGELSQAIQVKLLQSCKIARSSAWAKRFRADSKAKLSPPPTATWMKKCGRVDFGVISIIASAPTESELPPCVSNSTITPTNFPILWRSSLAGYLATPPILWLRKW